MANLDAVRKTIEECLLTDGAKHQQVLATFDAMRALIEKMAHVDEEWLGSVDIGGWGFSRDAVEPLIEAAQVLIQPPAPPQGVFGDRSGPSSESISVQKLEAEHDVEP